MTRLVALAIVGLAAQWPAPEQRRLLPPPPVVSHKVTVLRDWVQAVSRHVPGETDAALLSIAAWTRDDVQSAWIDVQALLALVKNKDTSAFYSQPSGERIALRTHLRRQDLDALRELATGIRDGTGSLPLFAKRAAILHSDVAREFEINSDVASTESVWSPRRHVVQTDDGRQVGMNGGIIHWEFGGLLLDAVPDAGGDEFVRTWYRASLVFKLSAEELDTPHFDRAIALFPNDAVVRFLYGCLRDAFAHPAVQSVVDTVKLPPSVRLDVRSESNELRLAESEFRRAIELDSAFGEARLRYGRVLARLNKHAAAAAELRQAVSMVREPILDYYARLFLGAEEEALGRMNDARSRYQEAAALYPLAQAPKVALSQLAHRAGNRAAAREALSEMNGGSSPIRLEDDPWWVYQRSAGRMADEWREATYRLLPR
jgi:tetratricopeptide (TPR) repeat protein